MNSIPKEKAALCCALLCAALFLAVYPAAAAILTVQTNVLGVTPSVLAYNSGHFFPDSNTSDWWRYSGVNGARVFLSPSGIEPSDDNSNPGDGVTDRLSFLDRRASIRTNQFNPSYINWSYLSNRYENNDLYPNNHIRPNYTLGKLRSLGIKPLVQITASQSRFPIAGTNDWPNMWELWQHYYFQAFYLGKAFDVERYQMFNEPNHSSANGLTQDDYLLRLQLAADAVQLAVADVNVLYGKSLLAKMLAPVTSGSAESSYSGGWGQMVVTNRHLGFFDGWKTNFSLIQVYDYHQYGSSPSSFGTGLANLHALLSSAMSPEPRFPTSISEFNTRTGATFDTMLETLDTPAEYARFGSIAVNLLANGCSEFYAFKFSQTEYSGSYPVQKNAMHYVDNANSPYNIGGITKAGEVYRLFNKAFAAGRDRLGVARDAAAGSLDVQVSRAGSQFWLFSVNNTPDDIPVGLDLAAWNIPVGNRVLIEEVSESCSGAVKFWTNLPAGRVVSGIQPAYSVWLLSTSTNSPQSELSLAVAGDAEVRDGANKAANFGGAPTMTARNDPATVNNRSAAFMKFNLAGVDISGLQFAVLAVQAASASTGTTAQAHVYALTNGAWTQGAITWDSAPNLRDDVAAGNTIRCAVIEGSGDSAAIVGQWVTTSAIATEKLLDVTALVRNLSGDSITFLVVQDPRWDVALPSLDAGDTQPAGVKIVTSEGGAGPQLRLVFNNSAPPNAPPAASSDAYVTSEDVPLAVAAPGVLANDFDPDGDPLSAVLATNVAHGILVLNAADGGFSYTPATNYFGTDSFAYRANDGLAASQPATVTISIAPVNDDPVAQPDRATTLRNTPVSINVLANDSDPDGGSLALVAFTPGANGSVVSNGNGLLTYAPGPNFTGQDIFEYVIGDGQGGTNSASVVVDVTVPGGTPYWTNLPVLVEAVVRGGASAATNQDEIAQGYLFVKYNGSPFDSARKVYFQFDLGGLDVNVNTAATFSVTSHTSTYRHRAQLWGLNQPWPGFSDAVTWNSAQANETNSNDLLTSGVFTATRIGPSFLFPSAPSARHDFSITNLGDFIFGNHVILAFTGVPDAANDTGGLRLARTNATLQVLVVPPGVPVSPSRPAITGIALNPDRSVTVDFWGTAGAVYRVQGALNLSQGSPWSDLATNVAGTNGTWQFTDPSPTNFPARFYRALLP